MCIRFEQIKQTLAYRCVLITRRRSVVWFFGYVTFSYIAVLHNVPSLLCGVIPSSVSWLAVERTRDRSRSVQPKQIAFDRSYILKPLRVAMQLKCNLPPDLGVCTCDGILGSARMQSQTPLLSYQPPLHNDRTRARWFISTKPGIGTCACVLDLVIRFVDACACRVESSVCAVNSFEPSMPQRRH